TIMINFKYIIITVVLYSVACLYGLIINFSDTANLPMKALFGTISFSLIMFLPILYKWIYISARKLINNFDD
ncbi:hypothetical protein D9S61_22165, partial [Escherichia coli]|nr:hypothetical protein [Escherichia coli]